MRWDQEPPYPADEGELAEYTSRVVGALEAGCEDRLVCVLLCGSWARGEAQPPRSDVDMFVVVRSADGETLDMLAEIWSAAHIGAVNVVGLDELDALPRAGQEMVTTNAKVLWGVNPFSVPRSEDFAADLSAVADSLARNARILLLYPWLTADEAVVTARQITGKWGLGWAARCLVAYRTGTFPKNETATLRWLETFSEGEAILSLLGAAPTARAEQVRMAKTVNELARSWLSELVADRRLPGEPASQP